MSKNTGTALPAGVCGLKTEVYSRVCGYHRPISNWNEGKREEFKDRKPFEPVYIRAKTMVKVA